MEDDNINVTIGAIGIHTPTPRLTAPQTTVISEENVNLHRVLNAESHYASNDILRQDLALRKEMDDLMCKSVHPDSANCIAVMYSGRLMLISSKTVLSSRAVDMLWRTPKAYKPTYLSMSETCEVVKQLSCNLVPRVLDANILPTDTFAIFSAKYTKIHSPVNPLDFKTYYNNSSNNDGFTAFKNSTSGIYRYEDFSLLIIREGKIVEYATHGVQSNINELLRIYNPKKIFYNATKGDALDTLLKYAHSPFFAGIGDLSKLTPVRINKINDNFNTLVFCPRQDIYCSFCISLREYRGLLFQVPVFSKPEPWNELSNRTGRYNPSRHTRNNLGKNHLNQPTHNSSRLRLTYASKTPNAFNGFDKCRQSRGVKRLTASVKSIRLKDDLSSCKSGGGRSGSSRSDRNNRSSRSNLSSSRSSRSSSDSRHRHSKHRRR